MGRWLQADGFGVLCPLFLGFRNIEVQGTQVLLNGEPIFLKGISIHEEIPMQKRRACTEADADLLLDEAQALGVNVIRLAHYQQSRHMVRGAERRDIIYKQEKPSKISLEGLLLNKKRQLPTLPRVCSTIGAGGLNFSVRNGKRWNPATITT